MMQATPVWRAELFAGLRVVGAHATLERFQTRQTEALLAYLILHSERRTSRDVLSGILWPDASPDAGRNRLSQAIGWLRPHLESEDTPRGSVLLADRQSIGLNAEALTSDVAEFERAVRIAETNASPERQKEALEQAIRLYTGFLLPAHDEEWIAAERQRLHDRFLWALKTLLSQYESGQEWENALSLARRAVTLDPLAEDLHAHVIRILVQRGDIRAATRHFQEFENLLARTLEQTPSPELRALLRSSPTPVPPPSPQLPTSPLPAPMTRFFGRETELETLKHLAKVPEVRLITLTGLGGTGKTRLATEAIRRLASENPGTPIWFVPLADLSDATLIPTAIADAMRLTGSRPGSPLESILKALADVPALMVLDNLEHLTEEAAPLLRRLLDALPLLTILVTSRQRLGLDGEQEVSLAPLPVPDETMPGGAMDALLRLPSIQLFLDRAQSVRADFALTAQNSEALSRLCTQLEGWPLAIELCAAWAQTLTPDQMLAHLTHRFDLLVSRRRDISPRHRTLRATLEYSYLLLPRPLQELLVQLSVFRGGWTLEAATAICADSSHSEGSELESLQTLHALTELRERSLIVAASPVGDAPPLPEMRYRMLETVRSFAAEQQTIAVESSLKQRHLAYFVRLAESISSHLAGAHPAQWLARLEAEHDNFRSALRWAQATKNLEIGSRLAIALSAFWELRGHLVEGQDWLEYFSETFTETPATEADLRLRAHLLLSLGQLARARGEFERANFVLGEGLILLHQLKEEAAIAETLIILGTIAYSQDHYSESKVLLEEALSRAQAIGDTALIARSIVNLGNVAMDERDWPLAWARFTETLELHRAEGNQRRISAILNNLGLVARYRKDYETAGKYLQEGLDLSRELANRPGVAISLLNLATVRRLEGETGEAQTLLSEATLLASEVDDKRALAWCIKEGAHLAFAEGDAPRGTRLLAASESLRQQLGISFKPADPEEIERDTAQGRTALGEARFSEIWESGNRLGFAEAATLTLQGGKIGQ